MADSNSINAAIQQRSPYLSQNDVEQLLRNHVGLRDERTHHIQHKVLDFDAVRVGNDGENEFVQIAEDLLVVLQVETDVERFDPGQILQEIKVAVEQRGLSVLQTAKLRHNEHEDVLQVKRVHVWRFGSVNSER